MSLSIKVTPHEPQPVVTEFLVKLLADEDDLRMRYRLKSFTEKMQLCHWLNVTSGIAALIFCVMAAVLVVGIWFKPSENFNPFLHQQPKAILAFTIIAAFSLVCLVDLLVLSSKANKKACAELSDLKHKYAKFCAFQESGSLMQTLVLTDIDGQGVVIPHCYLKLHGIEGLGQIWKRYDRVKQTDA